MARGPERAPPVAHAFVADLAVPVLGDEDRRHLERVRRLRPGEAVTVSDGDGGWRPCVWGAGGELEPAGPVARERRPLPSITVGFALTKGERPEWVVQKLTELGVDLIAPFQAVRSVVRWDEAKAGAHVERWRRVAREAAMQSRRVHLPQVAALARFAEVATALGPAAALAVRGGAVPSLDHPAVLVGPEGGWDPVELDSGLPEVSLGPTVLRAETAAMAAGVVLCGLRSGIIRAPGAEPGYSHTT